MIYPYSQNNIKIDITNWDMASREKQTTKTIIVTKTRPPSRKKKPKHTPDVLNVKISLRLFTRERDFNIQ